MIETSAHVVALPLITGTPKGSTGSVRNKTCLVISSTGCFTLALRSDEIRVSRSNRGSFCSCNLLNGNKINTICFVFFSFHVLAPHQALDILPALTTATAEHCRCILF